MREAPNLTVYQVKQLAIATAQSFGNLSGKVASAAPVADRFERVP